jgi:osmoprotectant transport system permease protein
MDFLSRLVVWFGDSAQWDYPEPTSIPFRVVEHVQMSFQATLLAALLAFPVGLYIGHKRRLEFFATTVGNLGRAIPSFGILGFVTPFTLALPGTYGFWAIFITLFFLAIPPILTNTYVAVKGIDSDLVEAARGMGMHERDVLLRVELPLAAPLVVAGVRTAALQVVATATLGAAAGWGGLGRYIIDGFATRDSVEIVGGAVLVALLAIGTEVALGALERIVSPRVGDRSSGRASFERLVPVGRP